MADWYVGSVQHAAIATWAANTPYSVGDIRRQLSAIASDTRAFRCTTAGISGASAPTWVLTKGATTTDGTAVWTEVTGNSAYGWSAAANRVTNYINGGSSWSAAGDTVYVANTHSETFGAAYTLTSPGGAANKLYVVCVDPAAFPPAADSTGAVIATNANFSLSITGFIEINGITFNCGLTSGPALTVASGAGHVVLRNCVLAILTNTNNARIAMGVGSFNGSQSVELYNTVFNFTHIQQTLVINCRTKLVGCSVAGTIPTVFASIPSTIRNHTTLDARNCDFSNLGSGKSWGLLSGNQTGRMVFIDCKENALGSYTSSGITSPDAIEVDVYNRKGRYSYRYSGLYVPETTNIVTGGMQNGSGAFSIAFAASANCNRGNLLAIELGTFWNESVGSPITFLCSLLNDGVTVTDAQFWLEVEALTVPGSVAATITSDGLASPLATPASQPSDSAAWVTTGLVSPVAQKAEVTVTPAEIGPIRLTAYIALGNLVGYLNINARPGGARQYPLAQASYGYDPAAGSNNIIVIED